MPVQTTDEILAVIVMVMMAGGALIAFLYIMQLNRFFAELRDKEPQVWEKIGDPALGRMMTNRARLRSFFAFYPYLKARRHDAGYRYAGAAYRLLHIGVGWFALMLVAIIALAFYL